MAELLPDRLEVSANPQNTGGKEDQEASVTSILEWVQCFGIYIDVIAAKHPERIQDLLGSDHRSLWYMVGVYQQFRQTAAVS